MTTSQKGPTHWRIISHVVMTSQCVPRRPNLNETKMRRCYDGACRVGCSLYAKNLRFIRLGKMNREKTQHVSKKDKKIWWWNGVITGISPEKVWLEIFRMNRTQFLILCKELRVFISPKVNNTYRALSIEKKVAVGLDLHMMLKYLQTLQKVNIWETTHFL